MLMLSNVNILSNINMSLKTVNAKLKDNLSHYMDRHLFSEIKIHITIT